MKKRILFVDDEKLALNGIKRLLWPKNDEWHMEFVDSGAAALKCMGLKPFDVVVSDMRMPEMNGAQLLNEIMIKYPKTIRLILSGYADRQLILKCVGSTHQYLAKPCDAHSLELTVQRALRLQESLESETLQQIVSRCTNLPSVPSLYSKIVETLQDPEVTVDTISEILVQDPALTAKILKIVNSSFFGLGHEISSPAEAVAYLGTDAIKSLVLFESTFSVQTSNEIEGFNITQLAAHSLQVAQAARLIAEIEEADRKLMDEAYLAGLLHDVGQLVFAVNLPSDFNRALVLARQDHSNSSTGERKTFEADHADLGGYLLGLWGLPVPVVEAIALHHKPSRAIEKVFSPLAAVHIANTIVAPGISGTTNDCDLNYLSELNLARHLPQYRQAWTQYLEDQAAAQSRR